MVTSASAPPAAVPLEIQGLQIRYGERVAVDDLSLSVLPGEIYGLLGSNGAGKTSTIKSVVGLVRPYRGSLRIVGLDPDHDELAAKAAVGYVPETALLYDSLTPREFLEYVSSVRRLSEEVATQRVEAYARALQIESEFEEPLATLSNGTRQKVILIAAFVHHPTLLVLDEPFNNLDPRSTRIMKELLRDYVSRAPRGVLFSTHTMEIAEQLCHRVGILDAGQLKGEGTLDALRVTSNEGGATLEQIFLRLTREEDAVREALQELGGA